ncbi:MAG: hypothetical protein PW843_26345 [Azospirillaceae bacterium]|nr:hypothetical protein [Azospirillaceae bacterium]
MTPEPDTLQTLWQSQKQEIDAMTLNDIKAKAARFEHLVRHRARWQYGSAALSILLFCTYVWFMPGWMLKAGGALEMLAVLYTLTQIPRRAPPKATVADGRPVEVVDAYRGALIHQRDEMTAVWRWYLLPYVPGIVLMAAGSGVAIHGGGDIGTAYAILALALTIAALCLVVVWLASLLGAARLQRRIDDLNHLLAE